MCVYVDEEIDGGSVLNWHSMLASCGGVDATSYSIVVDKC